MMDAQEPWQQGLSHPIVPSLAQVSEQWVILETQWLREGVAGCGAFHL